MTQAVYTPSASQIASAQAHLGRRGEWRTVHIDNVRYFVMPSSCATSSQPKGKRKRVYYVRVSGPAYGCDCPYYETGHAICSHILAAKEAINHDILAAWVDEQDRAAGLAEEGEVDLAFAEVGLRLRGNGAGVTLKTYEQIWKGED